MRKPLLIALVLATASGSAFAQAAALGNDAGTTTTSDDSTPAPKRTAPATPAESRKTPARSDTQRSSNPRWHSFLPGMFR